MTSLRQRLNKLEKQIVTNAEPIIIDVVFVNAAKQQTGGFQVKIPISGYAHRRTARRFDGPR